MSMVLVRYRTGTGTKNPQKWVSIQVSNIPGTVRYRYFSVKTGKYRYRTGSVPKMLKVGTESVPKMYSVL
ncbi:hypothetical protein HanIR_Chr02g0097851 [Helianthus annuus]|nr:hypothetical protein HanIR_Chr02g0097851 [Helianthus annuus]